MTINSVILASFIRNNKQWPQYLAVFSAALSSFLVGICFAWSSPSLAILQSPDTPFRITNNEASWIASLLPLGSAFGAMIGAGMTRYFGPKKTILSTSLPFLAGFILIIFANGATVICIGRFVSGIAIGFVFTSVPIYISEIAENNNRGALMVIFTIMIAIGGLFLSSLAPYVTLGLSATVSSIFALLLFVTFLFMPDSPYFLIRSAKESEAMLALKWFRRYNDEHALQSEIDIIKTSMNDLTFVERLKQTTVRPNLKALFIMFMIIFGQQFSGILPVGFYQEQIYQAANIPFSPEVAVILSQLVGIVSVFVSIFMVDCWGRKPLLLLSTTGCAISTSFLGVYYQLDYLHESYPSIKWMPVVILNVFTLSFSIGMSSIPYTVIGELFSSSYKEIAICIMSITGALVGALVTKLFQIVRDNFGPPIVFYGISGITVFFLIIIAIFLPETSRKSFLDIQNMLLGIKSDANDKDEKTKKTSSKI